MHRLNHYRTNLFIGLNLLWLLLLMATYANGQQVRFDHFDTRKGLSQNNIYSLVVDSTGYIWIGTLEGVTRFDGRNFDLFRSFPAQENSLKGNFINQLSACPGGNMWIHIRGRGLNLYDAEREKIVPFPDSCFRPANILNLSNMLSFDDSTLWFTDRQSCYRFNLKNRSTEKIETPSEFDHLTYGGPEQVLCWGQQGIYAVNPNQPSSGKQLATGPILQVSPVFNDSLCVVYGDSLHLLNLKSQRLQALKKNEQLERLLRQNVVLSAAGYQNEIWLGTNNGLLSMQFDGDRVSNVSSHSYDPFNNDSFHGKDAHQLAFDKLGNLWIGTSKYGVNLFQRGKNQFHHHLISVLSKADQEIDPVRSIHRSSDGRLWIGFDRLGLVAIGADNQQKLYSEIVGRDKRRRPLQSIRCLFEDSRGQLWIGTASGLCCYNQLTDQIESVSLNYAWDWQSNCYVMKEFAPGMLTVTHPEGIGIIDLAKKTLQQLPMPQNYIPASIRSIVTDNNSNYWFIADNIGLAKWSPGHGLVYFTHENAGLTDNKLYSLALAGPTIWIGSNNGLMAFDLKTEKVSQAFFEANGLSNNLVYSIAKSENYLWMSTNRGISRLRLADNHLESFLPEDLFMDDAAFQDKDGTVYFGGYDGFISFDPAKIEDQPEAPKVVINNLFLNNKKLEVGQVINKERILEKSIQLTKAIRMSYSTNSFSIAFDAFPFRFPDLTSFRYRLRGLSPEWILASKNEDRAVFANLPPGNYVFEVEANNGGQNWSRPAQLQITIVPPFYRTFWFQSLLLLLVIAFVLAIFRIRLYTIKKWNLQLETRIQEQTFSIEQQKNKLIAQKEQMVELSRQLHEADQAKLQFYTNVSHEFRTPLTIIMGNIESLKEQGVSQYLLKNIKRSSERLFRLVNQFIDLQKYDQGELKLEVRQIELVRFVNEIADSFRELAARKNIGIRLVSDAEKLPAWLDADKTDKIFYNLLSNAIKYTPKDGSVLIELEASESKIQVKVSDTGCGIPEKEQSKIFRRFYRSEQVSGSTEGHGMGLALVKALVGLQHGTIGFSSRENSGSCFTVQFKTGKSHFNPDEISKSSFQPISHEPEPETAIVHPSTPSNETILLVEDNLELMDYLVSYLGKYYRIETAANGKEALQKIGNQLPDLVITDLMMPAMDGLSLVKTLKQKAETSLLQIIVLSAKVDETSKIESFRNQVDDYIEKPFHPGLLLSRVQNLLKKRADIRNSLDSLGSADKNKLNPEERHFMEKLHFLTEQNYTNPEFNADVLAELLGMSRVSFYRKLKKIQEEGPGEFIRKYRLKKAVQLIREGNKSISEISTDIGFLSLSHFRKSFSEEYGVSPSKFR
ncbi:MAG: ATP-binding protein [Mangrovibacterium sp.]